MEEKIVEAVRTADCVRNDLKTTLLELDAISTLNIGKFIFESQNVSFIKWTIRPLYGAIFLSSYGYYKAIYVI